MDVSKRAFSSATPVIVTGMHRSGTSLLASAMQQAGVAIGDRLLAADESNVRGHFEDLDFFELHEGILADNGLTWYDVDERTPLSDRAGSPAASPGARQRPQRAFPLGLEGPPHVPVSRVLGSDAPAREVPFHLPTSGRRPRVVASPTGSTIVSPFRGAWLLHKLGFDTFRARFALRKWLHYNTAILDFVSRHAINCQVLEVAQLKHQLPCALRRMREAWNLPIQDINLAEILDESLLRTAEDPRFAAVCRSTPATRVLAGLRELAQA